MRARHLALILGLAGFLAAGGLLLAYLARGDGQAVLSPSLTPLTRLSAQDVDRFTIRAGETELTVRKGETRWTVGDRPAFSAKLDALWALLRQLNRVPTVAENPENHPALGVLPPEALVMTFWRDEREVGQLLVGKWSPETGATFIRRPGENAVAAVGADLRAFLAPAVDAWRDPTVVDVTEVLVGSLRFFYPDGGFTAKLVVPEAAGGAVSPGGPPRYGGDSVPDAGAPRPGEEPTPPSGPSGPVWVIETTAGARVPADPLQIALLLQRLAPLLADGFADDQWDALSGTPPAGSLEVSRSVFGAIARLDFYPKDETAFYVRKVATREVFLLNAATVQALMKRQRDLEAPPAEGSAP